MNWCLTLDFFGKEIPSRNKNQLCLTFSISFAVRYFFRIAIWPFLTMFARNKMIFPIVNFSLLHRHVGSLCVAIKTFKPSSRFVTWTHGVLTFWWFRNNQFKNVTKIHVIRKKPRLLTNCKNAFMAVISPLKMHL